MRITIALLAFALGGAAFAGDVEDLVTGRFSNGRRWTVMPERERAAFPMGMYNGMDFIASSAVAGEEVRSKVSNIISSDFTFIEVVKVIDEFYAETANARVPIAYAAVWAKLKLSGDTTKNLDTMAAAMRARFAEAGAK